MKVYFGKIEQDEISALGKDEISASGRAKKHLFLNFEHYDLAFCMMDRSKIW